MLRTTGLSQVQEAYRSRYTNHAEEIPSGRILAHTGVISRDDEREKIPDEEKEEDMNGLHRELMLDEVKQ